MTIELIEVKVGEQVRAEFEAAWRQRYSMHADEGLIRSRLEPESYVNTRTKDAWWAWQASRAALVIDLSLASIEASHGCYGNEENVFSAAQEAIEAAGLRVKS